MASTHGQASKRHVSAASRLMELLGPSKFVDPFGLELVQGLSGIIVSTIYMLNYQGNELTKDRSLKLLLTESRVFSTPQNGEHFYPKTASKILFIHYFSISSHYQIYSLLFVKISIIFLRNKKLLNFKKQKRFVNSSKSGDRIQHTNISKCL